MSQSPYQSEDTSVFVVDEQDEHPVDTERWARLAGQVLGPEGLHSQAELSILFVDEHSITEMNRRFMGDDVATDVLSFPIDEVDSSNAEGVPQLLGDVIVCPAVAARNAPNHAGNYDDEIALLLVHGILHLFGNDHAEPDERAAMQARERALLEKFHGVLAPQAWAVE